MNISDDIVYIGVDDHAIDLFESQFDVTRCGMSYNSFVILDEKVAVTDTVDVHFRDQWLSNLEAALDGRTPDYLIVHHMEPDHSANLLEFMARYPHTTVVATAAAFKMMKAYFGTDFAGRNLIVKQDSELCLGRHTLRFITAPLVHWPEVVFSYDTADKALFTADAFGKFGALDYQDPEGWAHQARRYYFGIVGKFGTNVQAALHKIEGLDIRMICPLHGPVLRENLDYYLGLYRTWSSYGVETPGVCIAYTSIYGHTKAAVDELAEALRARGESVLTYDLARNDMSAVMSRAFRHGKLVLATTTYCGGLFPIMETFMNTLAEHSYQKRLVGLVENGSWMPMAAKVMRGKLEGMKDITIADTVVSIKGALDDANRDQIRALADEMTR